MTALENAALPLEFAGDPDAAERDADGQPPDRPSYLSAPVDGHQWNCGMIRYSP